MYSLSLTLPTFGRLSVILQYYKLSADQYESDLLSVVNSLLQSIKATDLHLVKSGTCNASCVRFPLVKLLRLSGYDAAVCTSKWQGSGKVPGGIHVLHSDKFRILFSTFFKELNENRRNHYVLVVEFG